MTVRLDHLMQLADRAMMGVPHVNASETLLLMRYLTDTQREHAQRCYAALIGERTLPLKFEPTPKLAKPAKPAPFNRAKLNRAAAARRVLEERRDLENA